jgi:hypothetical protein
MLGVQVLGQHRVHGEGERADQSFARLRQCFCQRWQQQRCGRACEHHGCREVVGAQFFLAWLGEATHRHRSQSHRSQTMAMHRECQLSDGEKDLGSAGSRILPRMQDPGSRTFRTLCCASMYGRGCLFLASLLYNQYCLRVWQGRCATQSLNKIAAPCVQCLV